MHRISLPAIGTAQAWRDAARRLLSAAVPPPDVVWADDTTPAGLFETAEPIAWSGVLKVPRSFVALANSVVWHKDSTRFDRLYHFLWRLRETPHLMTDQGDADLAVLRRMAKNVHRCQHKMKAFVRFREIGEVGDARRSFAAWFEPTHHTVEPTAPFFARRFADMDWRIITPDVTASFVKGEIILSEGQSKPPLPDDANERLWITYFRNIFNPARLKVKAMQSEMPRKYWKNMPEAAAIPELIASAPVRARQMRLAAPSIPPVRARKVQAHFATLETSWAGTSGDLAASIAVCTRCDLHGKATQAVLGEGPRDAALMIVGEQPGDQEDLQGRPFVGPAGRLFDQLASQSGVERDRAYVTNAVKHFKFRAQGRRRLHRRPNSSEVMHCKWWLDAERAAVRPRVILAMGSTAALAITGNGKDMTRRRGVAQPLEDGSQLILTFHPSYLLRLRDPAQREAATGDVRHDMALAHRLSRQLA